MTAQSPSVSVIQTCESSFRLPDSIPIINPELPVQENINSYLSELVTQDRLEAGLDSLSFDEETGGFIAYIHVGPEYNYDRLSLDSLSIELLKRLDLRSPRNTQEYITLRDRLAAYYASKGYPFARIRLVDIELDSGRVMGYLEIDEDRLITMDSIIIHGDLKLRQSYLKNYLDIYKGGYYDHSKITSVRRKMDQLNFLQITQDPSLTFIYDYASLNLYAKGKNTSRFDLIFGVIPTNNIAGRQLFLSMDATAEMLNKLGYGEYIYFEFERLRPEQQRLELKFNYPYILDTKFAIDTELEIFRNALAYQTLELDIGIQYLVNSLDKVKVAWNYESSRIITIDTLAVLNPNRSVQERDVSVVQTGLSLSGSIIRLDHRFNPRKGLSVELGVIGGQKKILVDPVIVEFRPDFYDELTLSSYRLQSTGHLAYFFPVGRRGTIGTQCRVGYRYSPAGLFRNELFQIGGNKLLRGFDEASIFTPYYAVLGLDSRLLLSENSYLSAPFFELGYIQDEVSEGVNEGVLTLGLGAGLVLETKVGMFNFSVAVAQKGRDSFDFSRPKAHFGYISLF